MLRCISAGSRNFCGNYATQRIQAKTLICTQQVHNLSTGSSSHPTSARNLPCRALRLVEAYRTHGHKIASIDPLGLWKPASEAPELDPVHYGFASGSDTVETNGYLGLPHKSTVEDLVSVLDETYCSKISVEFEHLIEMEEREWFAHRFEQLVGEEISNDTRVRMGKLLLQTQVFDNFLASKYPTLKRYGGEGAEGNLIFMDQILSMAAGMNYHTAVACMPHRGRLNVLAINLGLDPSYMFRKIMGKSEFPDDVKATGDVLSHLSASTDLVFDTQKKIHVTMLPNPSQLEANNPVAVGKARGRQQTLKSGDYANGADGANKKVLCIQIHGDASFAGQGIVAETFTFANLPNYSVGGSVHFITNNQIGFTTPGSIGRSSLYSSDISKINSCPVIHVNGESPEDVLRATKLALEYKDKFNKDVVIDMLCYRLHGHNEVDDPTFTQPIMYETIKARKSIPDLYASKLATEHIMKSDEIAATVKDYDTTLREAYNKLDGFKPKAFHLEKDWTGLVQPSKSVTTWDTGFPVDALKYVGAKSVEPPQGFNAHPHLLKTHVKNRLKRVQEGTELDWATAEALAVGSLLLQGFDVRLSGQDVGRGTFSHRHAVFTDHQSNKHCIPLNYLTENQETKYEVANSVLSEEAVLGFDYGMSIESAKRLVIWEAQFGDFFTGAQIIIDTYVTAGETKWLTQSGIVMLLPHGYDGAGPEHSSCRIERFLQQTDSSETSIDGDDVNFSFANPTTPAQYFHLLRRQMVRNYRKPLIMAAPKTVLRLPAATSNLSEMAPGTTFSPVLPDPSGVVSNGKNVKKILFVSGKHYYTLDKHRETEKIGDTAIIRVEELCPFPAEAIRNEVKKYPNAKSVTWSQEEPRNMGAWSFVKPRFENLVGVNIAFVGRPELPAVAVGIGAIHEQQNKDLLKQTFA